MLTLSLLTLAVSISVSTLLLILGCAGLSLLTLSISIGALLPTLTAGISTLLILRCARLTLLLFTAGCSLRRILCRTALFCKSGSSNILFRGSAFIVCYGCAS
ncbi:hypothetical protein [Rothia dentocariosa]|uniref:hypothetical protein n=1 Tax=Rothia dentocariosa TaxID=2047 RepID=UPI0015592307|nr:hypothetical protein [Rothia dentocariosa]